MKNSILGFGSRNCVGLFGAQAARPDWGVLRCFRQHQFARDIFTSPLFLPDQGPNYQLNNGQFTSSNRWFMEPQSRVAMFGGSRQAPLYFEIDQPSEEQIIMNSSFGLGVSYQSSSPFWFAANYAYKPQNQIHLGSSAPSA